MNYLNAFKDSLYLGHKNKKVHNEPTEAYFFLIKYYFKPIKINKRVCICIKKIKSDIDGT